MDPRVEKLAQTVVHYSLEVKKGEKVLINYIGDAVRPFVKQLIKEIYAAGAYPFVDFQDQQIQREILMGTSVEHMTLQASWDAQRMSEMDCYIGVSGRNNLTEMSDVPSDKMTINNKYHFTPVHHNIRVPKTRWIVMRYPTDGMAQSSSLSFEGFENFYFDVCNLDYSKMSVAMDNLVTLMEKTDKVRIVGQDTDLSFSIKGIPAVKCDGKVNLPDGEVYTAPIRESVNGKLSYNTPAIYQGFTYENICFEFENGKIVKATANNTELINDVLNTDEGARYIGEFAIGVNPYVINPMKETLFDEKIMGSIHFTPGNCYDTAYNGNKSAIHWDLVYIQTPEYGGGEIYFDDVLIRKDGMFVIDELLCLNPDALK